LALSLIACGGGNTSLNTATTGTQASFSHVFLLVEENHGYSEVIGNSSMPYLNSLASQYGVAAQYYADTHPSIGNYFMLTSGQLETNDDSFSGIISDDNIVRELINAGKSWKCYAESLPSTGYLGGDVYPYLKHHDPFAYLSDVNSNSQAANIVPFSQFSVDLSNGALPSFSFIIPNALDDAHDGTLDAADNWLQQNIQPLITSAGFQKDGLLVITFDESEDSDTAHGGGHVATVIVSAKAKAGYQSQSLYQHESVLRLILSSLGITTLPGSAATASRMNEFFR
jgi:phosphatidylinositol-3-phosphatase